jgi:hypothetical protein
MLTNQEMGEWRSPHTKVQAGLKAADVGEKATKMNEMFEIWYRWLIHVE